MELAENIYITKKAADLLKNDWTMGTLATAQPSLLTKYKGIGKKTAENIVDEAQRLVHQAGLNQAYALNPTSSGPTSEDPPMSARVRRIKEQNQQ